MIPAASEYPDGTVKTQRRAVAWQIIGVANMMSDHQEALAQITGEKGQWLDEKEMAALAKIITITEAVEINMRKLAKRFGVEQ